MNELISFEKIAQWQKLKTLVLDTVVRKPRQPEASFRAQTFRSGSDVTERLHHLGC